MIRRLGSLPKRLTPCIRPRPRPSPTRSCAGKASLHPEGLAGTWQAGSTCPLPSHPLAAFRCSSGLLPHACELVPASRCRPALARRARPPSRPAARRRHLWGVSCERAARQAHRDQGVLQPLRGRGQRHTQLTHSAGLGDGQSMPAQSCARVRRGPSPPKCAAPAIHPWCSTPATTCMRARPRWSGTSPTGFTWAELGPDGQRRCRLPTSLQLHRRRRWL